MESRRFTTGFAVLPIIIGLIMLLPWMIVLAYWIVQLIGKVAP